MNPISNRNSIPSQKNESLSNDTKSQSSNSSLESTKRIFHEEFLEKNEIRNVRSKKSSPPLNEITKSFEFSEPTTFKKLLSQKELLQFDQKQKQEDFFANEVIKTLKNTFGLIEEKNELYWLEPRVSTGQNITFLKNAVKESLVGQDKIKNNLLLSVRLKLPHKNKDKKETSQTYIAILDSKGSLVSTMEKDKLIGSGTFGNVFRFYGSDNRYALKLAKTRNDDKELFSGIELSKRKKEILNEMQMLAYVHQEGLIPGLQPSARNLVSVLRGNSKGGESEAVKTGFFGTLYSGDASFYLDPEDGWDAKNIFSSFQKLASGLHHCHRIKQVVHGDIKPENIFVQQIVEEDTKPENIIVKNEDSHELVLADFGGAMRIDLLNEKRLPMNFSCTADYVHANDLDLMESAVKDQNREKYRYVREKMDIFGLGASFYFMLTTNLPYPINGDSSSSRPSGMTNYPSRSKAKSGFVDSYISSSPYDDEMIIEAIENRLETFDDLPNKREIAEQMGTLIHQMVCEDAEKRPTAEEVVETLRKILETLR